MELKVTSSCDTQAHYPIISLHYQKSKNSRIMKANHSYFIKRLSEREQEIIKLLAYEYSTKEIANLLYIGYETVKTHRKNIISKLNVRNVAGVVRVALQKGIIPLEDLSLKQPA